MSGLDTSQDLTVDASKHAEEHHEHSVKPAPEAEGETTSADDKSTDAEVDD